MDVSHARTARGASPGGIAALSMLTLAAVTGCAGGSAASVAPPVSAEAEAALGGTASRSGPEEEPAARLVVVVVLDQLAGWLLDRYEPLLDEDGAIRRGSARGVQLRVRYPYAATQTAAGHAAIFTGGPPSVTGILANEVWDRDRGAEISSLDDGQHAVLGAEGFASPTPVRAEMVADSLRVATSGRAKVVSVSLKDRGAIPGGGLRPDFVAWYDPGAGRFTSSTYYVDALPAWLVEWQSANPLEAWLTAWEPDAPARLLSLLGPDDRPGESDWLGLGRVFPHDARRSHSPASAARAFPQSAEHLLALAEAAVDHHGLGVDEVPDLLAISISSTDIAGHVFGPESWEFVDHLIRVDRALGAFLSRIEQRASTAVLITADHGVAPTPESSRAEGHLAERHHVATLAAEVDRALDRVLGPGRWVDAVIEPYLYLSSEAEAPHRRDAAVRAARAALEATPGILAAYDVRVAADWQTSEDAVERAVALSIHPEAEGDVYIVPAPLSMFDPRMPGGAGTNHGSPWDYDREVPVVFWGPGVSPARPTALGDQRRVASTIAALLGIAPPPAAPREVLEGAPRPVARAEARLRTTRKSAPLPSAERERRERD